MYYNDFCFICNFKKFFFYNALNNKVLLLNISVLTYNKQHIYYSI